MGDDSNNQEIEIGDFSRLPAKPVVTVLMMTYNHAPYLAEAIEGVLSQRTDFPIELLIADDASSDGARDIGMRYQREHPEIVRIVTGPVNIGARANRRRASRRIRGEFLAFCEGDDYWTDPEKLQKQVEFLRAHPQAGAVHTDFDHIIFRGGRWRRLRSFQVHRHSGDSVPQGDVFSILLRRNFVQTCTLCVRTELDREFINGGFLKDIYLVGDWPLCLYIAARLEIAFLPESTATYRVVPGSMMNSEPGKMARIVESYLAIVRDFCDMRQVGEGECAAALAPHFRRLLSLAVFAGDVDLLDRVWVWLSQNDPVFLEPWRRRVLPKLARYALARKVMSKVQRVRERLQRQNDYT